MKVPNASTGSVIPNTSADAISGPFNILDSILVKPTMKKILNIFDPIMFPNAISKFFFVTQDIETINSGSDVPMATTVIASTEVLSNPNSALSIPTDLSVNLAPR